MQVTETRIHIIKNSTNSIKAIANVTFDNQLVVHNVKIIEGNNGTFVSFPSEKDADGKFKDIVHPINSEARNEFSKAILAAYNSTKEKIEHLNKEDDSEVKEAC